MPRGPRPRRPAPGRPLQRALAPQALVADARLVARPPGGRRRELGEDLGGAAPGERLAVPERAAQAREDLPVGQRLAGRVDRLAHERRRAARSWSSCPPSPATARPAARRARGAGLGRVVGVLQTTSSARRSAAAKRAASGWRDDGVGGDDPDGLDAALLERVDELGRGEPGRRRDAGGVRPGYPTAAASRRDARGRRPSGSRAAASSSPPVSRPPIALGWPVSDSGPLPGRPMLPVARQRLMIARFLSVPTVDWLTPIDHSAIARGARAEAAARRRRSPRRHAADLGGALGRPLARGLQRLLEALGVALDERRSSSPVALDHARASRRAAPGRCPDARAGAGRRPRRSACGAGRRRSPCAPSPGGARMRARRSDGRPRCWCRAAAGSRSGRCPRRTRAARPSRRRRGSPRPRWTCTAASWSRRCSCRGSPSRAC